ncbi:hypothetical protein ASF66_00840 [Pseudomonas sp. Leaf129]|uniref:hypothetical protein n=1 Tax=Pseudomonas sp. Leaf129 TaxID=1736268 RepID=UPI000702D1BF|nr:hypothetical protein [Pseudomonas sp. Leaf129]KQQ62932.1 hypothetical protein ASF66_00840 [Pseudomonas sp. Leaf129]
MTEILTKDAVKTAVAEVGDLFGDQGVSNILLEEVDRSADRDFLITIGFDRDVKRPNIGALGAALAGLASRERVYKVVCLESQTGMVKSIKDRLIDRK